MTLFAAWRDGMTLEQAVHASLEGRAWAELYAGTLARYRSLRTDPRSPLHDRMASLSRLQAMAEDWERQVRLRAQAEAAVQQALADAVLLACGFDRRPGQAEPLVPLAPELWRRTLAIDWPASAVRVRGWEREEVYGDIRVLPAARRSLDAEHPSGEAVAGVGPRPLPDASGRHGGNG